MRRDYKVFNKIKKGLNEEEVEISSEEKEAIKNRVLKKIKKNDNKSNRNKKRVLVGAVACTLFTTVAFTNEGVIAKVNQIGRSIERFFEKEESSLKEYKRDNLLLEKEDKGIKLIVNEAIYNDREILVSTTIDYNNIDKNLITKKGKYNVIAGLGKIEVYSNGKKVEGNGEGVTVENNEDGTADILLSTGGWREELADEIEIRIGTDSMDIQYPYRGREEIKGDWSVKFKIDTKKVKENTKVINIDKNLKLKNGSKEIDVRVNDLRITPLSMRLGFEGGHIGFEFYDEKGKEINFISGGGGSDSGFSYNWIRNREIEKIKIVPLIINGFDVEKRFEELAFELNIK